MKKFWIPIAIFIVLGVVLASGLWHDPRKIPSPLVGKALPAFELPSLKDPNKVMRNADFAGRVVLINVWASWCAACKTEHPLLVELARRNLVPIVGLNYKDARADALQVLASSGDPYVVSLADTSGRTGIDWGVYGVPETFLIDKQGVIRHKHIGPITRESLEKELLPLIQNLL